MEVVEETHRQIYFPPIEQANNWQMEMVPKQVSNNLEK